MASPCSIVSMTFWAMRLAFEMADVIAVRAIGEEQRHRRDRQHLPHATGNQLCEYDREGRPMKYVGQSLSSTLGFQ
jgi:hypothetical protein